MARPTTISDQQILDAARAVFLERGISATTAEVARKAGVAEGSIFKRFKSKEMLFHACLALDEPEWFKRLSLRGLKGDFREHLFQLGAEMVQFFGRILPLIMMAWSNPTKNGLPSLMEQPNPPPLRALKRLAAFFEAAMRKRLIRRHDPEIVARMFLGAVQNYVFFEVLMRAHDELPLPLETYLRGMINVLWNGVKKDRS